MKNLEEYISSGVLEAYILGLTDETTTAEILEMTVLHPGLTDEIEKIERTLLNLPGPLPGANAGALVMATIDYTERLRNGELPEVPPLLHEKSLSGDYEKWLGRPDMALPDDAGDVYAKIIGYTPEASTLIVWLKTGSPHETHTTEKERFLILEGSCDIVFDDGVIHRLHAGQFIEIPLYMGHTLTVTSETPCKVVLQRVAA